MNPRKTALILLVTVFAILWSFPSYSQPVFRYSDIPPKMLENSNSVIRNKEVVFEVFDKGKAVERVKYVLTVLNSNGLKNAVLRLSYDKFETVRNIKWHVYDQDGKLVKNRFNTEVRDFSAIPGYSLYEDNRIRVLDPEYRVTPFTVEYSYEIVHDGLLSFPVWNIYDDYNISVQSSVFTIIAPDNYRFRYVEKNLPVQCTVTHDDKKDNYTWHITDQPSIREEPFSAPLLSFTPVVYTAPDEFELDGFTGNMETWEGFSRWIYQLGQGREALQPATVEKVRSMTDSLKNDHDKIEILYRFLQEKVRYVSIQEGIGGWQTIEAAAVDRLSYGDCKALSNYMKVLLGIAGIHSVYTLVHAGQDADALLDDFPSNQFNHVLLCVPLHADTIWLECTNQHIPAGYIGKFTDDRKVLLVGSDSGKLVRTKAYTIDDNLQIRKASVLINPDGSSDYIVTSTYSGIFYEDNYRVYIYDDRDRKELLRKKIGAPAAEIRGYKYSEVRSENPALTEELTFSLPGYGTRIGDRIFFNPNLMTRIPLLPVLVRNRIAPIEIRRPYCEADTIDIGLPSGFRIEFVPSGALVTSKFGVYKTSFYAEKGRIRYTRNFRFYKGIYPPSDYPAFTEFLDKVALEEERKVNIIK